MSSIEGSPRFDYRLQASRWRGLAVAWPQPRRLHAMSLCNGPLYSDCDSMIRSRLDTRC